MKTVHAITFLLLLISTSGICQDNIQNDFINNIENTSWSCEDSIQLEDYEMMVVSFAEDSITHGYLNWLDGLYSNRCSYVVLFTDSYFELELGGCREPSTDIKYVYGYLTEGKKDELNILLSEKNFTSFEVLKKQEGWIPFERFDE